MELNNSSRMLTLKPIKTFLILELLDSKVQSYSKQKYHIEYMLVTNISLKEWELLTGREQFDQTLSSWSLLTKNTAAISSEPFFLFASDRPKKLTSCPNIDNAT